MITRDLFEIIKNKYGYVASWAAWDAVGDKPKSNMGNMAIFEPDSYSSILQILNVNVVLVGLNVSRDVKFEKPFMNFHDSSPYANDFKIRYALRETPFYGAYMTDIIKNLAMVSSKDVLEHLKENPEIVEENINSLREELLLIQSSKPIIIAFGADTFDILKTNLNKNEYSNLVKLTHYSHQISKENYKKEVYSQLYNSLGYVSSITEFFTVVEKDMQGYISRARAIENIGTPEEISALIKAKNTAKCFYELLGRLENT